MKPLLNRAAASIALLSCLQSTAYADEGMWTFHSPPMAQLKARYQFELTPALLEKLRLSAVQYGASASFVSADGLIMTNHHVALGCVQRLSSEKENLAAIGFLARNTTDERTCPGAEAKVLMSYDEVTKDIQAAVGKEKGEVASNLRQEKIAALEKACASETNLRCNVVTLYRGGQQWMYRYKVWQDVRLVFAPERGIGFFGGDTDNFVYPRYNLDVAFLRAYENGKPVKVSHFLKPAKAGLKEGDLVFAIGNPGGTDRQLTHAELMYQRLQGYPIRLSNAEDRREVLVEFGKTSAEAKRRADSPLFGLENGLKVLKGETKALAVERLYQRKRNEEAELKRQADALIKKGEWRWNDGAPWKAIEQAVKKQNDHAFESTATDYTFGTLLRTAGEIVALAMESSKPEGERLRAYSDTALPVMKRGVTAFRPVYLDLEEVRLTQQIEESMSYLGQEHPFVARLLQGVSAKEAAKRALASTKLDDGNVRRALVEGGAKAVAESTDSLIVLARDLYPLWRKARWFEEREIEAPKRAAHDEIARLKFKLQGTNQYPDATGTLRFSFGKVAGYDRDGIATPWMTTFYGLYERNLAFDNKPPFDLPDRWLAGRDKLNLATPFNVVTTLDIIGGNSGSPIVNTQGEWVGVVFDGNLEGLGNRFQYQERTARATLVDARAIMQALEKIYDAKELVRELTADGEAQR
ncbi:MAG: S46 family peptidase [Betaproteobacteria bacterium]|nr:S46 family peptidase [Betaproteobacteria bacterium]